MIPLHTRTYDVVTFRKDATTFLLRGEVLDQKPPGLYIEDDPEPLTVHHMIVELTVQMPSLDIVDASVVMETHPQATCPQITPSYQQLVGLSIARGFSGKVRKLFGGPLGCTHTTALLLAMAPVAVQTAWSMNLAGRRQRQDAPRFDPGQRAAVIASSLNTCHVWAEDGAHHAHVRDHEVIEPALPMQVRLRKLGREA